MLQALLRGKLSRDHEQIEDILTSNVFGLLKYDGPDLTLEFLSRAALPDGKRVLDSFLLQSDEVSIGWEFWPWWPGAAGRSACEPDVVITLENAEHRRVVILIEAKLNAAKSSLADERPFPSDQLAREWDNLATRALIHNAHPILIYLTGHFCIPRVEIAESMCEFRKKRGSNATIAWLSWRELRSVLERYPPNPIRDDLRLLLERMNLTYFEGIASPAQVKIEWQFQAGKYDWRVANVEDFNWRFE